MINRCNNITNKDYIRYGGRGIKVCERWSDVRNFYADMGDRPEGMTLDRIDNDGDYELSNCRWATPKEQTHNSRAAKLDYKMVTKIRKLYTNGHMTQKDIGKQYGVDQSLISRIINYEIW